MTVAAFVLAAAVLPPWEDPYVTSSNRLPARAVFVPASSMEEAVDIAYLEKPRTVSKWVLPLDGTWDFEWKARPDTNVTVRSTIKVPGCWQLQGDYDPPIYSNIRYPHVKNPPHIMEEPPRGYTSFVYRNPVGMYRRTFTVPEEWSERRVVLHFGGVYSAFYVRINGVEAGYSEDSRLPAEFDVTEFLGAKGANNEIEVEVYRWCDGSYLEDQDFWRLSGIYRSVWLVAEKKDGLKNIVIEPLLSADLKTGEVKATLDGAAAGNVFFAPGRSAAERLECRKSGNVASVRVDNPALWDCDNPKVYTLVVEDRGDWYAFPVGFRKIAIENSVLKINNRRVLIKGVNRHEMSAIGGYTVTLDEMKKDIELFKDLNINAVRTCHYPDDPDWYTLCDIEGIYVTCEANIESHGMGYKEESLSNREDYRAQHIERDVRMVDVFRNHPSIIVWSQGNEAGCGENFALARKAVKERDPSRPVQYENRTYTKGGRAGTTDINCPMYRRLWTRR